MQGGSQNPISAQHQFGATVVKCWSGKRWEWLPLEPPRLSPTLSHQQCCHSNPLENNDPRANSKFSNMHYKGKSQYTVIHTNFHLILFFTQNPEMFPSTESAKSLQEIQVSIVHGRGPKMTVGHYQATSGLEIQRLQFNRQILHYLHISSQVFHKEVLLINISKLAAPPTKTLCTQVYSMSR